MPSYEDRIEARKEELIRYLERTPRALQQQAIQGMVAQTEKGRTQVVPWYRSMTPDGPVTRAAVRNDAQEVNVDWGELPELRKRSLEERIQSMVARLMDAPEPLRERLIAEAAGEYWKAGMPVTQDALRATASKYLNRGDTRGPIQVTRTTSTGD